MITSTNPTEQLIICSKTVSSYDEFDYCTQILLHKVSTARALPASAFALEAVTRLSFLPYTTLSHFCSTAQHKQQNSPGSKTPVLKVLSHIVGVSDVVYHGGCGRV